MKIGDNVVGRRSRRMRQVSTSVNVEILIAVWTGWISS